MKILYFSYLPEVKGRAAGSANKAIGFMNGLRQLGHKTHIFWRERQPVDGERIDRTIDEKPFLRRLLSRYLLEPKILLMNTRHILQEQQILARHNPDALIWRLTLYGFSGLAVCRRNNIPFLVEADCPPIYENNTFYGRDRFHLTSIAELIERQNLLQADAVLVLSNVLKQHFIEKGIPREKMHVIPNGADPDKFYPLSRDMKLAEELNIGQDIVIGWIGSLAGEWSGIQNLIEMTLSALNQRDNIRFLFVGGGKNRTRFENAFREQGILHKVILPGTIDYDQIPRYLSLMDIVIAPYPKLEFWYPSSMKIFEYMSSGKAVLASDVGQVGEIIVDSYNGLLFDSDRKGEVVSKMLNLCDSPGLRQMLGQNARKTVLEKYTW
jgi:glycosyltransferase involved in cell wall biosynthesis